MESTSNYDTWVGRTAYGPNGDKVGEIKDIFTDDVTGRPEWVEVKAGLLKGTRLVPLAGARIEHREDYDDDDGERLLLQFDHDRVAAAPDMDTGDEHLSAEQERELYAHYGFNWDTRDKDFGYGKSYDKQRFGAIHEAPKVRQIDAETERRVGERTEEVPVHTEVRIPIETSVRLRKWQTEKQHMETRQVQVPVTETEEHVEVVDERGQNQKGTQR